MEKWTQQIEHDGKKKTLKTEDQSRFKHFEIRSIQEICMVLTGHRVYELNMDVAMDNTNTRKFAVWHS
jgi:hypothetical protein